MTVQVGCVLWGCRQRVFFVCVSVEGKGDGGANAVYAFYMHTSDTLTHGSAVICCKRVCSVSCFILCDV